jgi:pimeloyl-ACP methyl ester carboxylesterase
MTVCLAAGVWSGCLVAVLVAAGTATCSSPAPSGGGATTAAAAAVSAASGDYAGKVTVGGRQLYLECHGSGSPTVGLQSGYGNGGDIWSAATAHPPAVAKGLAATNRVCAYDRPGTVLSVDASGTPLATNQPGRSDPVPMPRTSTAVVAEWHDLLATAGVPGPYLLVGHSIGGLFTVLYARTYPEQVAGMVTVDATPPTILSLLSPATQALLKSSLRATSPVTGSALEQYDLDEILRALDTAPAMRPIPVTLLFAGKAQEVSDPALQAFVKEVALVQDQARADFTASIPGATMTLVADASHYIQVERPDAVIEAVRSVAAKIRPT